MSGTEPARPTLLLIHGFPQDHTVWNAQIDALADVADVLAPDLRGFGAGAEVPEVMTMEAYADDLAALLDERGRERVVLCGLSMGGYVALAFAERHRDRCAGLVLSNTRSIPDGEEGRAGRYATAERALHQGVPVIARGMLPGLFSTTSKRIQPERVSATEQMMARQHPRAVAAAARGMAVREDRTPLLHRLALPALVITGSEDTMMPEGTSQAMHAALAGSRLVVIPNTAHLPNVEAPDRFNDALRAFLCTLAH